MTSEGLGEMFEGDSADTCARKFPLVLMGGRAEGLACADTGARTPIGASGNVGYLIISCQFWTLQVLHIDSLFLKMPMFFSYTGLFVCSSKQNDKCIP